MNTNSLQTYLVGGAVRDGLLNLPIKEKDWVVTGSSPEDMTRLRFKPVGKDFPVFLHPQTGEEYALARTERKSGHGYQGFTFFTGPEVSLEDDLQRRDLTINAIAKAGNGELVDPYQGRKDLENRILRHVSPSFIEDPLRVLRVCRFAARFHHLGFRLANETLSLMRQISVSGELHYLTPERVWQECQKALGTENPDVFFTRLRDCGALKEVFPEIDALFGVPQPEKYHPEIDTGLHTLKALQIAATMTDNLHCRFAVLVHDLGKAKTPSEYWPKHHGHEALGAPVVEQLTKRLGASKAYARLGTLVCKWHLQSHRAMELKAETLIKLFNALDVWRRPQTLEDFLICCEADARGRTGLEEKAYPQANHLRQAYHLAAGVSADTFSSEGLSGKALGNAIEKRRLALLADFQAGQKKRAMNEWSD